MSKPTLRQEYDLATEDFVRYPAWRGVHGVDEPEKWYESCDEATFRPWREPLPARPEEALLLVAARFTLANGASLSGAFYSIPLQEAGNRSPNELAGDMQPRVFLNGRSVRFWGGFAGVGASDREHFYALVQAEPDHVFPITFEAQAGVTLGIASGVVEGFYQLRSQGGIAVERDRVPQPLIEPEAAIEPTRRGVMQLANRGQWQAALDLASALIAKQPADSEAWNTRSTVHFMRGDLEPAIADAIKRMECHPALRDLYVWICFLQVRAGRFEECIRYSDVGLAASEGSRRTEHMDREQLTFLGARALFETRRCQEAVTKLESVGAVFSMGRPSDLLMTKKSLLKACQTALGKGTVRKRKG